MELNQGRQSVPQDVNTLIVARPTQVPARVQWQIDQFVMRGGRVIFMVDPMRLDDRMGLQNPIPITSGLDDMLAAYGVKLDRALVQDRQCENAGFSQGYIRYYGPLPALAEGHRPGTLARQPGHESAGCVGLALVRASGGPRLRDPRARIQGGAGRAGRTRHSPMWRPPCSPDPHQQPGSRRVAST